MMIALFVNWHLFPRSLIANIFMGHTYYDRSEKLLRVFLVQWLYEAVIRTGLILENYSYTKLI